MSPMSMVVPRMGLGLTASCQAKLGLVSCGQGLVAPRGFSPGYWGETMQKIGVSLIWFCPQAGAVLVLCTQAGLAGGCRKGTTPG